jgi:hypothetical protein
MAAIPPIVSAIYSHDPGAVQQLVEQGVPVDDETIQTAFSTLRSSAMIAQYNSANNADRQTYENQKTIFLYLIGRPGVNLNMFGTSGKTLLYEAINADLSEDIIRAMIRAGAQTTDSNMDTRTNNAGNVQFRIGHINANTDTREPFTDTLATTTAYMDNVWIQQQMAYMEGLSAYDKAALYAYTYQGDAIINSYLRGYFDAAKFLRSRRTMSLLAPFHKYILMRRGIRADAISREEFFADLATNYRTYIEGFIWDLNGIVLAAPRTTKPIKLFRGIKNPLFMYAELKKSRQFQTSDFQSTSLDAQKAVEFAEHEGVVGAVIEILVGAGTPCLFMEMVSRFEEMEVLLPLGIQMFYRQTLPKIYPLYSQEDDFMVSVIEMMVI